MVVGGYRWFHCLVQPLQGFLLDKSSWAFPNETLSEVRIGSKGKREG